MKKNLVILFVFIFSAFLGYSQENKKSDLAKDNIKGKVKYIEESTYYLKGYLDNNEIKGNHRTYKITKFNMEGNIEHEITKGLIDYPRIIPLRTITYRYNSAGKKIEQKYIEDSCIINNYIYDEVGNLIQEDYYQFFFKRAGKIINKYDSVGNLIERCMYRKDETLNSKTLYKYDSLGRNIETKNLVGIIGNFISKYDSNSNEVDILGYDDDSNEGEEIRIYDKYRNILEYRYYKNDSLLCKRTIKYKYDKRFNWVWQKTNEIYNENKYIIIERRIVYYGDKDENDYPLWDNPNYKAVEIKTENMRVKF